MKPTPRYPFPDPPTTASADEATALEVGDGVLWVRMPLPFALDHINVWLLADGSGWTVVDTGLATPQTRQAWEQLFATVMQGKPVQRIIITHFHPDHFGSAAFLADRFSAPVYMTAKEIGLARDLHARADQGSGERIADLVQAHGLREDWVQEIRGRANGYRQMVPQLPKDVRIVADGEHIRVGAHTWEVHVGRGHAPEHACLYCAKAQLLISGDQVLPRISSNVSVRPESQDEDPLSDYIASLNQLRSLPADTRVLPSHGLVFESLHERLQYLIAHHQEQLDTVYEACREPQTAADLLPKLFRREITIDNAIMAMGESAAHLRTLECRGQITRTAQPPFRYQRRSL